MVIEQRIFGLCYYHLVLSFFLHHSGQFITHDDDDDDDNLEYVRGEMCVREVETHIKACKHYFKIECIWFIVSERGVVELVSDRDVLDFCITVRANNHGVELFYEHPVDVPDTISLPPEVDIPIHLSQEVVQEVPLEPRSKKYED